jgi:cell division protein FtsB
MQVCGNKFNFLILHSTFLLFFGCLFLAGCGGSVEDSLWQQIRLLEEEKHTLEADNEKLQRENQQLNQQAATLQSIAADQRTAALNTLYKIEIGSRSGLFDKDNNGSKETLVVYVKPMDVVQDGVKAAGQMEVQLWNLDAADPNGAMLKQWKIQPEELTRLWAGTIFSEFYRLNFPVDNIIKGNEKDLTVKVKFTDYFTGKVLQAQQAIR